MISEKMENAINIQAEIVDFILSRYVNDEAGKEQEEKFNSMTLSDKVNLLTNTLNNCCQWADFETDLIINFDYCNY